VFSNALSAQISFASSQPSGFSIAGDGRAEDEAEAMVGRAVVSGGMEECKAGCK
jgi:hypothetical protein